MQNVVGEVVAGSIEVHVGKETKTSLMNSESSSCRELSSQDYATTSAALKLLRRCLTLRKPGRSPLLFPGLTTALAPFFIHSWALVRVVGTLSAMSPRLLTDAWCPCPGRFGTSVGSLDGEGDAGRAVRRGAGGGAGRVATFCGTRADVAFASLGILFGGAATFALFAAVLRTLPGLQAAAAAERVIRVGRCSEAVTLAMPVLGSVRGLWRMAGCAPPRAGRTSSLSPPNSSSDESVATRFAFGVLRGCPGGAAARARADAAATCLLGVTGGTAVAMGAASMGTFSISVSAGGVTGATIVAAASAATACVRRVSSAAAHFTHSSCLTYMNCCCGPTTHPGRTMRIKAIASLAVNPYFQTRYAPMRVPVRPRPALHYPLAESVYNNVRGTADARVLPQLRQPE